MFSTGKILRTVARHIRTTLVAGVLIAVPVGLTAIILKIAFDFFDGLLEPFYDQFTDVFKPGMGVAALVIVIYLTGLTTTHFLGRRLIELGHGIVDFIPVVRSVYRAARQATEVFSSVSTDGKYTSVVLVEFPGYGLRSIGLVTAKLTDQDGNPLLAVYVPTSPFPTSGFLLILPEDQVTPTDLPVDDAMKLIVSAGIVAPAKISTEPVRNPPTPTSPPWPPRGPAARTHDSDSSASNQ